jgi:hypothetical protein
MFSAMLFGAPFGGFIILTTGLPLNSDKNIEKWI